MRIARRGGIGLVMQGNRSGLGVVLVPWSELGLGLGLLLGLERRKEVRLSLDPALRKGREYD